MIRNKRGDQVVTTKMCAKN